MASVWSDDKKHHLYRAWVEEAVIQLVSFWMELLVVLKIGLVVLELLLLEVAEEGEVEAWTGARMRSF